MKKVLMLSSESYGRDNVKVELVDKDIERVDLHDLLEMLIAEYPEKVNQAIDDLGDDSREAEEIYNEDYTEDFMLIYFNGGENMYATRLNIIDVSDDEEVDIVIEG